MIMIQRNQCIFTPANRIPHNIRLAILILFSLCLLPGCGRNTSPADTAGTPGTGQPGFSTAQGTGNANTTGSISNTGNTNHTNGIEDTDSNTQPLTMPELGRIRQICELVTVECTYHNVAKSTKAPGTGLEHIGETERTFWIEYMATAEISYDVGKIAMNVDGSEITITLPRPQVTCKVDPDSWNENSYVISQDQFIQKNPITAADQTKAINLAQAEMIQQIRGNSSLINTAKLQAQELIKNYIDQIGEITGIQYHITWKDAESGS